MYEYQLLTDEEATQWNEKQLGSKCWGFGKWDHFVKPFLPDDCSELSLVDNGCNAGIFLKCAEDHGFEKVTGVEKRGRVYKRALRYRGRNGGKYTVMYGCFDYVIDTLPVVDFTILSNVHYYLSIEPWVRYLDKLINKSCNVVVVTAHEERGSLAKASPLVDDIRAYFNDWDECGYIDVTTIGDDPLPRHMSSLFFKNRHLRRASVSDLSTKSGKPQQFFQDLSTGKAATDTRYFGYLKRKFSHHTEERVRDGIEFKAQLFRDITENGQKEPILIDRFNRVLEGNHRLAIARALGRSTILAREV